MGPCEVVQTAMTPPQPPPTKCWDHRSEPPHSARVQRPKKTCNHCRWLSPDLLIRPQSLLITGPQDRFLRGPGDLFLSEVVNETFTQLVGVIKTKSCHKQREISSTRDPPLPPPEGKGKPWVQENLETGSLPQRSQMCVW